MKIFVDTSAWISYFLPKEEGHLEIDREIRRLVTERHHLYTSNDVMDESVSRLVYHHHLVGVAKFIKYIQNTISEGDLIQLWTDAVVQTEAFKLVEKFYEHKLSLTDATSIVLVHRFKLDAILTLDEDFRKVGMKVLP